MKKTTLTDFLGFLNNLSRSDFQGPKVDKYLKENALDDTEFLPYLFFREDTYGRNLIHKTENYEMLALTWLPNQRTAIHDHAGSRCWVYLMSGTLHFKNYHFPKTQSNVRLEPMGCVETHSAEKALYIDDGIAIHSIANASKLPAVSIHLYAGPVERCRIYDEAAKTFDWVELAYFTRFGKPEWEVAAQENPTP